MVCQVDAMAVQVSDTSFCRRNSKLETFLQRNAQRHMHAQIRYYEACVVVSEELDKVFMHVVLTDDSVYLTEYHPRKLLRALNFSLILHMELINDLPDFLSGKDQEQSLHIRITHTRLKDQAKQQPAATLCQQDNYPHSPSLMGISGVQQSPDWKTSLSTNRDAGDALKFSKNSVLYRLKQRAAGERKKKKKEEKKEAELHLYAVISSSQIYVHLQRSWNSYIMRSTLMLSPCTVSSSPSKKHNSKLSWERTCHLFSQLSGELLVESLSLEGLYLLIQELCTAARHNPGVKTLFWRSPELYPFLVKTLTDRMQLSEDRLHAADRLLLSVSVLQTIGLMFGETEKELVCSSALTSQRGSVTADLLSALVCDPELKPNNCDSAPHTELQVLQAEYLDAASSLMFEVVMFCQQTSRISKVGHFLTVPWIFRTLEAHPFLVLFMAYQAQRVVLALSSTSESPLNPVQAVRLYQRCCLLLTCMQHNTCVNTYILTELREEYRYYVRQSELEDKLPPHYPISRPAKHLVSQLLSLVLDRP